MHGQVNTEFRLWSLVGTANSRNITYMASWISKGKGKAVPLQAWSGPEGVVRPTVSEVKPFHCHAPHKTLCSAWHLFWPDNWQAVRELRLRTVSLKNNLIWILVAPFRLLIFLSYDDFSSHATKVLGKMEVQLHLFLISSLLPYEIVFAKIIKIMITTSVNSFKVPIYSIWSYLGGRG